MTEKSDVKRRRLQP